MKVIQFTDPFYAEMLGLEDAMVSGALDVEICDLLQVCFPNEDKFGHRRYYNESPHMRWMIREGGGLVAHIASHEKTFRCANKLTPFCGISEVCVHPDFRGRGLLPRLLDALEGHYMDLSYDFSILLGPAKIYERFGYQSVRNLYFPDQSDANAEFAMYKALRSIKWPEDAVSIEGPYF